MLLVVIRAKGYRLSPGRLRDRNTVGQVETCRASCNQFISSRAGKTGKVEDLVLVLTHKPVQTELSVGKACRCKSEEAPYERSCLD